MLDKKLILFMALAIIFTMLFLPATEVFASGNPVTKESGNPVSNRNIPIVGFDPDGNIELTGMPTGNGDAWTTLFTEYRSVIAGISGIGALTMIVLFIFQFMKLASSAGNPSARSQALTGVLWTGIAAVGLGAVSLVTGFFYNFL